MVLLEHLSGVDIARNHVASLRSEPSAVVIGGDARCVTLTTEPFVAAQIHRRERRRVERRRHGPYTA